MFHEKALEPLLHCEKLHTLEIDGLEVLNFETITLLMNKVWRYNFTCIDASTDRKIVYADDAHVRGFCKNTEFMTKLFPQPTETNNEPDNPLGYASARLVQLKLTH